MKLGEMIRAFRDNNDMTMQEFADRSGLSKGYISMLEKNKHPQSKRELVPSFETYKKVASAIGMSLDDFLTVLDGDEVVRVNATTPAPLQLTDQEEHLVISFRGLNEDGREKAIERVEELLDVPRYRMDAVSAQIWEDAERIAREEIENAAKTGKIAK